MSDMIPDSVRTSLANFVADSFEVRSRISDLYLPAARTLSPIGDPSSTDLVNVLNEATAVLAAAETMADRYLTR
ncbi:MAG TPA: hypothetical protein VIA06_03515 [Candidatus Dormibacteraeota bacterium]|jgi:hypothetical protein|nr:hypothetical protein [Candidatus Dormibacteraeota bacterium]